MRQLASQACREASQFLSMTGGSRLGIAQQPREGGFCSHITLELQDESVELGAVRTDHAVRIAVIVVASVSPTAHRW